MLKNKVKYVFVLVLLFSISATVFAAANDWWTKAGNFFSGATASNIDTLSDLTDIIQGVGNMMFIVVTVILGIKYIYGGADSKSNVKDSLITLVVAAIAFYSWTTIETIFISGNNLSFINSAGAEESAKNIYSTILYICNYLAVGGIIYVGIKYLLAGAEGRASLKTKSVPIILGIIMVYATLTFLTLAVSIVG